MRELIENIRNNNWPRIDYSENQIKVVDADIQIVEQNQDEIRINLYFPIEKETGIVEYNYRYNSLHTIIIQNGIEINKILTNDLKLRFYRNFDDIFKFKESRITTIQIKSNFDKYEKDNSNLNFHPDTFEICNNFNSIYKESKSYSNKLITYKSNQFAKNYFGIHHEKKH